MPIKVASINFVKESEVPQRIVNTEFAKVVEEAAAAVKKGIPKDQAMSLKISGAKKYTRYQLQKRLQKMGHKVRVSERDGTFFVARATE